MLTEMSTAEIEYGLHVLFDGNTYLLMDPSRQPEYPVGGLICEYCRLTPSIIKDLILECDGLEKPATPENFSTTALQLHNVMSTALDPVTGIMITVEIANISTEWFKAERNERAQEIIDTIDHHPDDEIKKFIFENTNCTGCGGESVLQLLLTCYLGFANSFIATKSLFTDVMERSGDSQSAIDPNVNLFFSLYSNYLDVQQIDYRLVDIDGKISSMYTIKNSLSLLLFEFAQILNGNSKLVKCKNCGNYFVPMGRSDSVYCQYPLSRHTHKTCRDVGAQRTRMEKEKSDIATREYRKKYMRYKMITKRHPDNITAFEQLEELTHDSKIWRKRMKAGEATVEDFLLWLDKF